MRPIKIIQIITRMDKGGSAETAQILCCDMPAEKYNISLVYGLTSDTQPICSFKNYCIKSLVRNINIVKDFQAFIEIYRLLKKIKPDIVHTHSSKAGFIGRFAAYFAGVKNIIYSPHGHIFYGYNFTKLQTYSFILLERIAAVITTKLIALTEGEKNETLALGIGKPSQWEVVHSGVEFPPEAVAESIVSHKNTMKQSMKIDQTKLIIGTVARIEHVKGIPLFVKAAGELRKMYDCKNILFLIVGDGSERALVESMIDELGMRDYFLLTGMREDVYELMGIMDVFVQPSLNEGMGKTLIQAQSVGLPIIATRVQGIPDAVKEGDTAFLVPSSQPKQMAEAILKLIEDPALRQKMGRQSKQWVNDTVDGLPRFSCARMILLLERIYDSVGGTNGKSN